MRKPIGKKSLEAPVKETLADKWVAKMKREWKSVSLFEFGYLAIQIIDELTFDLSIEAVPEADRSTTFEAFAKLLPLGSVGFIKL